MDRDGIQLGDRVINLQVPGIFIVVRRRGHMVDLEGDRGLRMSVHEIQVRRLDGSPPAPREE
jgi:hypothetical protein